MFSLDPLTKFWCGYNGHQHVVLDEFRGGISISHLLRWLDRYPVLVELKGSSTVLKAQKVWITSNLHPRSWYPELDEATVQALLRRLQIFEFTEAWVPPEGVEVVMPPEPEIPYYQVEGMSTEDVLIERDMNLIIKKHINWEEEVI